MRKLFVLAAALTLVATVASAEVRPEFRPFVGAYVPTGDQSNVLESSLMVGGQVGVEMVDMLHLVGTFAYATPKAKAQVGGGDVHIFQYDLGGEAFRIVRIANDWTFRPFIGAGAGARTHDVRDRDGDSQTYFAGYGALGSEFQLNRIALRVEARDYISRFKGLYGNDKAKSRNDLMLGAALAFHIW